MPKKKRGPFYYFMKEVQEERLSRGQKLSMTDLPSIAHPMWKNLSVAEKERYERMAKEHKDDPIPYTKLAADGTKVEDNERLIIEAERKESKMVQDVKRYLNIGCGTVQQFKDSTSRKVFYILSFNVVCRTEEDVYIPNEVGLVEYSIQKGIHREYHKFINPSTLPTGYMGEAKRHSEDKHQIPIFGPENAVTDPRLILDDIIAFINPHDAEELPPVFCVDNDLDLTRGCLDWLLTKSRVHEDFRVWKVVYLLMELRHGVGEAFPSIYIAETHLNKNCFDYHPSTRCEFHEEIDIPYCALGYSKRLCFFLSDAVCQLFDVFLTEKHIPSRALEKKDYEILVSTGKTKYAHAASARGIGRGILPSNAYSSRVPSSDNHTDSHRLPARRPGEYVREQSPPSLAEFSRLGIGSSNAAVAGRGIGRGLPKK